jgi:hypothetical protein
MSNWADLDLDLEQTKCELDVTFGIVTESGYANGGMKSTELVLCVGTYTIVPTEE